MQNKKRSSSTQSYPIKKIIPPRSRVSINVGQYSENNPPPKFEIGICATNEAYVECKERMLGSEKKYTLVYEFFNRNDSPCSVSLNV